MEDDFLGQDIKLIEGEIALKYNDFDTVQGVDTVIQDIITRLYTPKGSLFYDESYGSQLHHFIQAPMDKITLMDFEGEIKETLKADPRVSNDSIKVILNYNSIDSFEADVIFALINSDSPFNLVVNVGKIISIWSK